MSSIIKNTVKNLNLKVSNKTKKWIDEFKKLDFEDREVIISDFEKLQSLYIRDSMANLKKPISLISLGRFYYKEGRKDFYELKDQNLDREEILKEIKKRYKDRKNNKKNKYLMLDLKK